jgi:hypothetical protein
MQSISGNDQLVADNVVILCAPSCLGAHKMMNAVFFFFRTASQAFAALKLCMWSDPIMIRPHAKYHCQICVFDGALQLRRPWSGSSGTESVHTIRSLIPEYIFFPKSNTKKQTKIV